MHPRGDKPRGNEEGPSRLQVFKPRRRKELTSTVPPEGNGSLSGLLAPERHSDDATASVPVHAGRGTRECSSDVVVGLDRVDVRTDLRATVGAAVPTVRRPIRSNPELAAPLLVGRFDAVRPAPRLSVSPPASLAPGACLASCLVAQGQAVVEVNHPDRRTRRAAGKSDPIDAEAAARAALSRVRTGLPKRRDGQVEALRNLRVARRSAVPQRADCLRRIKTLIITAPQRLRGRLRGLSDGRLLETCAGLRPDLTAVGEPEQAVKVALRMLDRRHAALRAEIVDLDALITPLIATINPALLALNGVGPDSAGQLLVTAGQNTDRLRSEGAFAMLCGVAPIPASSGTTTRHRLNRGGDR